MLRGVRSNAALVALLLVLFAVLYATRFREDDDPETRAPHDVEAFVPRGALLVATADLAKLRASPLTGDLLSGDRMIAGVGNIRSQCGFDPLDRIDRLGLVIPEGGADGDFGLIGLGPTLDDAMLLCATAVIATREGMPITSQVGSFSTVRDGAVEGTLGEIAVRPGGPILLGSGTFLRALVDAADGRFPRLATDGAHMALREQLGPADIAISVVFGEKQRAVIADELERAGGAAPQELASVKALGLAAVVSHDAVMVRAMVACDASEAAEKLAPRIREGLGKQAEEPWLVALGLAEAARSASVKTQGATVEVSLRLTAEQLASAVKTLAVIGGLQEAEAPPPP